MKRVNHKLSKTLKLKEYDALRKEVGERFMDAVQDISVLENKYGYNSISVFRAKREAKKVEKNLELADYYFKRKNLDEATMHLNYAKDVINNLERIIKEELSRKKEEKVDVIPMNKIIVLFGVILFIVMLLLVLFLR